LLVVVFQKKVWPQDGWSMANDATLSRRRKMFPRSCGFSLFMLPHLCTPKAPFLPYHTPLRYLGPNYLAGQVVAGIYPKKDQEKVCKILWHSEGGVFVAHGGLARMTCT
jgi:hypothetical protein